MAIKPRLMLERIAKSMMGISQNPTVRIFIPKTSFIVAVQKAKTKLQVMSPLRHEAAIHSLSVTGDAKRLVRFRLLSSSKNERAVLMVERLKKMLSGDLTEEIVLEGGSKTEVEKMAKKLKFLFDMSELEKE